MSDNEVENQESAQNEVPTNDDAGNAEEVNKEEHEAAASNETQENTEAAGSNEGNDESNDTKKDDENKEDATKNEETTEDATGATEAGDANKDEGEANKDADHKEDEKEEENYDDPSLPISTTEIDAAIRIHMGKDRRSYKPTTIISWLTGIVQRKPGNIALSVKRKDVWINWTYQEYLRDIRLAAKAFMKLGVEIYDAVSIFGFNAPEWYISNFATIFAGGISVGIYTTSSPDAIKYMLEHSSTAVVVVENTAYLQRVLKAREGLSKIKAIIQYTGEIEEKQPDIYTWSEFMEMGKDISEEDLDERAKHQRPNKCCSLIYTSGTTGNPKGTMLCHDNLIWNARITWDYLYDDSPPSGQEKFVSYLPLSHIAAQIVDIYMPLTVSGAVHFARPDALKGTLVETLKEVHPTFLLGVPRVWEKIAEKLQALGRQNHGLKKKIANWAKNLGLKGNLSLNRGGSLPYGWGVAKALVFKKIKIGLGLDKCRLRFVAAAPVTQDTIKYYMSIDLSLQEAFGLSESAGPHTISPLNRTRLGSCGKTLTGMESKIFNPDEDGIGEICAYGRHVFMGYLNNPEKTAEAIDSDGWLHTGDIGKIDSDGYVYITGRQKEIIITSGGENVAPVGIEEKILKELPILSNVMLVGDKRKYLSCLFALKVEVNPDTTAPTDTLTAESVAICKKLGVEAKTVLDVLNDESGAIKKALQEGLDRVNEESRSRAQKVQKFVIIEKDFSIPGGELGPTLKLKRGVVLKKYAEVIDKLYAEE